MGIICYRKGLMLFFGLAISLLAEPVISHQTVYGSASPVEPKGEYEAYLPFLRQLESVHGVEPQLVLAIMKAESAYNPQAISRAGARGLMQLMPLTAQGYYQKVAILEPQDTKFFHRQLLDQPDLNILLAVQHLSDLQKAFASVKDPNRRFTLVVASYNAGFTRLRKAFGCERLTCVPHAANRISAKAFHRNIATLPYETEHYIKEVGRNFLALQTTQL